MHAAIVERAGQVPVYGEFAEPAATPGLSVVRVVAAALSPVTRSRATGSHYSAEGWVPHVPGVDGVGVDEAGRRVYFLLPEAPYGALAEHCLVDPRHCIALPEALGDVEAAALAIPAMSSWAALVERARLRSGETVLVNGATGASGRLAIQVARYLGAGRVVATGRNAGLFDELRALGADATIALEQDRAALAAAFEAEFRRGVDIVLDYLWGPAAETLIVAAARAGPEAVPVRIVQVGAASGADITLPGAVLRSSAIELMGSGIGSIARPRLLAAIRGVLEAAPVARFQVKATALPLADVTAAWDSGTAVARIVLQPSGGGARVGAATARRIEWQGDARMARG